MAIRFRKSFKIAPGVRMNLGKGGFSSVRVGGRGYGLTMGKRGTHASAGLPGTGVGYSGKVGDISAGLTFLVVFLAALAVLLLVGWVILS